MSILSFHNIESLRSFLIRHSGQNKAPKISRQHNSSKLNNYHMTVIWYENYFIITLIS